MSDPGATKRPLTDRRSVRLAGWLIGCLTAAVLIGSVSGAIPPRFRLLGLAAVGQGFLVGWIAARFAKSCRLHRRQIVTVATSLMGASTVVVTGLIAWQAHVARFDQHEKAQSSSAGAVMAAQMLAQAEQPDPSDPDAVKAWKEFRRGLEGAGIGGLKTNARKRSFLGFLTHRVSSIRLGESGGLALWCGELLLGGLAAGLVVRRSNRVSFCESCEQWFEIIRQERFLKPIPEPLRRIVEDAHPEVDAPPTAVAVVFSGCRCSNVRPQIGLAIEFGSDRTPVSIDKLDVNQETLSLLTRTIDEAQGLVSTS